MESRAEKRQRLPPLAPAAEGAGAFPPYGPDVLETSEPARSRGPLGWLLYSSRGRFIRAKVGTTLLVLLGSTILVFALTLLIPGNPAQIMLGPNATPDLVAAYTHAMGLDRPVLERLFIFLGNVLRGDFGQDAISGRPIIRMVLDVFPYTLTLTVSAIFLSLLFGVPLGAYAASHPGSWLDQFLAVLSVSFIAIPNFVIAVFLVLIFSVWLNWLPVLGIGQGGVADTLARLILPSFSIALGWIGYIARLLRASLLEVLSEQHIRTLRAYGVPERRVIYRYALKLAAIPTVAVLGIGIGQLLGGAIFAEIVFARPGIGTLVLDAINARDYPVVQASVLLVVGIFTITNLAVDMLYGWLDPRLTATAR